MSGEKRSRKGLYFIIIAAVITIGGYVTYKIKKTDFLNSGLRTMVNEKTNQLYKVSYDSIYVNEADGNLFIKNLYVKGDTARQMQMIDAGDTNAAKMLLDIYVPLVKLVGFKTGSAVLSKQIECREVLIENPVATVFLFPGLKKPEDQQKQQKELYKQILGNLKLIKADTVSISNARVSGIDFDTKAVKFNALNTGIYLSNLAIDSTYNQDTTRTLFCKQITVSSERVFLGEPNKSAEVKGVTFDTRTKILALSSVGYDAIKDGGLFKGRLEGISLQNVSWTGPMENSEVVIGKAIFSKGDIEALSGKEENKKQPAAKDKQILTGWVKSLSLNNLTVKSVTFTSTPVDRKQKSFTLSNNVFAISNLYIDRSSAFDESLVKSAKNIEMTNSNITVTSGDKMYQYSIKGARLSTRENKIWIQSVNVTPLLNETAFAKKAHYQTDRYDIGIRNIEVRKIDMEKLLKGQAYADQVVATNSSVKVFRDLAYPIDSSTKISSRETFPHQLLHKLSIPLKIGKFVATNTYIEYKEKNPKTQKSGRVRFSNSNLSINNITNLQVPKGATAVATFSSTFLEKIPISGKFTFLLQEWRRGKFLVEASVDKSFDATILNQLFEPMSLIRIDKGTWNSLKFNLTADSLNANGNLVLTYQDMKISLLKKKGDDYGKKNLLSVLANLIVKNKNKEGDNLRKVDITYKRDTYRSFFNYIWMSLFSGMRKTFTIQL